MFCKTNTQSPEQQRHFFFSKKKKKCVREQHLEKKTTSLKHSTYLCTVCQKLARSSAGNSLRKGCQPAPLQAVFTGRKGFRNGVSEHLDLAKNHVKRHTAPPPLAPT